MRCLALFAALPLLVSAQGFPPHRIIGNVYYVGDSDLASFLIVTDKGDILINKIGLGGAELTAHLTPGHTQGSVSYSMEIVENGRAYHVLIANLGTINPGTVFLHNPKYPQIAEDYARTFRILEALPCDVFLTSHASQYGLRQKYKPGMPYSPDTFVDPDGYHRVLARQEAAYLNQLAEEREEEQAFRDHLHFKDATPH